MNTTDIRGAIVELTSSMLDNPDQHGIYPTTEFYEQMEDFIHKVEQSALQRGREEAVEIATEYMEHLQFMKFCDAVLPIT